MKRVLKKLQNQIVCGYFDSKYVVSSLSQEDLNHLLYFSYQNNKFQAFHELLPYWKSLEFNNGKNLINSLVDNFMKKENTLIEIIEKIEIKNDVLNFYHDSLNDLNGVITNSEVKKCVNVLNTMLDYKLKKNLSNKLSVELLVGDKRNKMVKI